MHVARQRFIDRLAIVLQREGIGGWLIKTPTLKRQPRWFSEIARRFRRAVEQAPRALPVEVDVIKAERVRDSSAPLWVSHCQFSAHQPFEAVGDALVEVLRKKMSRSVKGLHRYLVALNGGMAALIDTSGRGFIR